MELGRCPGTTRSSRRNWRRRKVLVDATSIGLTGDDSPIPSEALHGDLLVLDLRDRPLCDAVAAGATVADGEPTLLDQGRGRVAPVDRQPAPATEAKPAEACGRSGSGRGRTRACGRRRCAGRPKRGVPARCTTDRPASGGER